MAYHGVKFGTVFRSEHVDVDQEIVGELARWCNEFARHNLAPTHPEGTYGNLSARLSGGRMLITATSLDLGAKLVASDFVVVHSCEMASFSMEVSGNRSPSSETPVHWALYEARPEVMAIFHGHNDEVNANAADLGIAETAAEKPYGSLELVEEVLRMSGHNFFNMKNHGFIAMGTTLDEAGALAMQQVGQATR